MVALLGSLLPLLAWAPPAAATPPTLLGSPLVAHTHADTRGSSTFVNLGNRTTKAGAITQFRYLAQQAGTVRFVVVEPAAGNPSTVQWVSPPVAIAPGAGFYTLPQHLVVQAGAAIGTWSVGASPFFYDDGGPVAGVTQPMDAPVAGQALTYDPVLTGGRTIALQATFVPDAWFGTTWFETRPWSGPVPTSAANAVAVWNGLSGTDPRYCSKQIASLAGASNQTACFGLNSNIGYHASVALDVFTPGTWDFRLGPDFGGGGALLVDGVPIDFKSYDIWWGGTFGNAAQHFAGSIPLSAGPHVFELYGFEGCCDGAWGAQVRAPGSDWVDLVSNGQSTALRPQTIVFGSTPPVEPLKGASYVVQATGGASGNPVVLSMPQTNAGVCRLVNPVTVRFEGPGTCVVLADQAGSTGYTPAAQASQTIVVANAAPKLSAVSNLDGVAAGLQTPIGFTAPTATDLEDGTVPTTCAPPSGSSFGLGTTTVTCTATDRHGATATTSFTVTLRDVVGPFVSVPPLTTVEATGPFGALVNLPVSAHDAVFGPIPMSMITCTPFQISVLPIGTIPVICTAIDPLGNPSINVGFGHVRVVDTTPPKINGTLELGSVDAAGPDGAVVTYEPLSAFDVVDGASLTTCSPASGSVLPLGPTTITCAATDRAGNTATATSTVVVTDGTAPQLLLPADLVVEAWGPDGAPVTFEVVAADDVSDVDVTCSAESGSIFGFGATAVDCTAVDAAGNASSGSFGVTVVDTTAPALRLPETIELEASAPSGAVTSYVATATDRVDGDVVPACSPADGSTVAIGTTTVECTAVDARGNASSGSFTVVVRDTTAPDLTVPADLTVEATGPAGAPVAFAATATDAADADVALVCGAAPGTTFGLGTTTVECTASDDAGNATTRSFDVTVQDTTAPVLDLPGDQVAEATGPDGALVTFATAAEDVVGGAVAVDCSVPSGATFALGATTVTCTADDAAGNRASGSFAVAVVDTTAPTAPALDDVTVEATGPDGAAVAFGAADAADAVDVTVEASCAPGSGDLLPLGEHEVVCSYLDAAGNRSAATFTAFVVDTTAPAIGELADVSAEAVGPAGAVVTYTADPAADLVDGDLPATCSPASGATFALGATTVTCEATDAAGNTGRATFSITVTDTTGPLVVVPTSLSAEATGPDGAVVEFTAVATDLVDGDRPTTCVAPSGSTFGLGETAVVCRASDTRGNAGSAGFHVTVVDTTPPVLAVPDDVVVEATGPDGAAVPFAATAVDVVDGDVVPTCSAAGGDTFASGVTVVTCSAVDAAGNESSGSFTITVGDTTAPTVRVPLDRVLEATSPAGATVVFSSSASDVVDGDVATACTPASGATVPLGTTTVTCTATDAAGNTGSATFQVEVVDTTAPVITFAGNAGAYDVDRAVAITCTVSDAVSVGLACDPVSGAAWTFTIGTNEVVRSATDAAGNAGTARTSFVVAPSSGGLCAVTTSLVTKAGIANSLCVKLRAGSYGAYRNELSAQSGKAITAVHAARLTAISRTLG